MSNDSLQNSSWLWERDKLVSDFDLAWDSAERPAMEAYLDRPDYKKFGPDADQARRELFRLLLRVELWRLTRDSSTLVPSEYKRRFRSLKV
jgi:hypothetical protein